VTDTSDRATEFRQLYQDAVCHAQTGHAQQAELAFLRAASFAPELWCDMATKLAREGQEDAALAHFQTALKISKHPGIRSGIFNNVSTIYARRGQLDQAIEMLELALKEDPQSADALCNLGQIRKWQGNLEQSDRYCEKALALNPWHGEAQFLQALNALDRGDYLRGFELYECRWRSKANGLRKLECPLPEWTGPGASFEGKPLKRIFVYGEQGAGDIFLMLRYAPLLRAAGMWQSWAVKKGMAKLLEGLVDHCSENGEPPLDFDCHIPSASLPWVFKTTLETIPPTPYIRVPADRNAELQLCGNQSRAELELRAPINVGICWRGNKSQYSDRLRSTNLGHWLPVLKVPGVTFHSMQVDGGDEALLYPQIKVKSPPHDWLETAQRLAELDLLISTDTGIVHLAGAMGLPVWCALYCRPYFVFPRDLPDTPWYPSVRLFKQQREFEWQPVFENIAQELRKLTAR
jgi:Tfp pilus assembly protein PilF